MRNVPITYKSDYTRKSERKNNIKREFYVRRAGPGEEEEEMKHTKPSYKASSTRRECPERPRCPERVPSLQENPIRSAVLWTALVARDPAVLAILWTGERDAVTRKSNLTRQVRVHKSAKGRSGGISDEKEKKKEKRKKRHTHRDLNLGEGTPAPRRPPPAVARHMGNRFGRSKRKKGAAGDGAPGTGDKAPGDKAPGGKAPR